MNKGIIFIVILAILHSTFTASISTKLKLEEDTDKSEVNSDSSFDSDLSTIENSKPVCECESTANILDNNSGESLKPAFTNNQWTSIENVSELFIF